MRESHDQHEELCVICLKQGRKKVPLELSRHLSTHALISSALPVFGSGRGYPSIYLEK
jgi:uncharacterized protein (DUF934 family)